MTLNAIDADDRAEQMIVLTERLTGRLEAETRAFEARRPHEAAAGSEETLRLANLYRHESLHIHQNPKLITGSRKDLHARLVKATKTFQTVLARHGRAVAAAKTLTEGLVQAIAGEVAAQRGRASGYGAHGMVRAGDASAIALNRRA